MRKIKVLSLFSGIGAFEKALNNIGVKYELVGYSEICQHASKAYSSIHDEDESKNLGDICKIDEKTLPSFDLMTWGFPCVNFSRATRNKKENRNGLNNDASGLYFEGLRILKEKKPLVSIIENVPDLMGNEFEEQFNIIKSDLCECGYISSFKVLSAKDYNVPQNRKRLIIVSIREDIFKGFEYPNPVFLSLKAGDLLLPIENIDEKFKKVNHKIIEKIKTRKLRDVNLCPTITKAIGRAGSSSEYISNCAFVYRNTGDIRRMTPMETLLFQGFTQEDYCKAKSVVSDSQIYNFSGNTIPVTMLEAVLSKLLYDLGYLDIINKYWDNIESNDSKKCSTSSEILLNSSNQFYFNLE